MANTKSPWTNQLREQLSALLRPEETVPQSYYLSPEEAWERLGGDGPVPSELDAAKEREREFGWARTPLTSRQQQKMTFTKDRFHPLVALWSQVGGLEFVLDLAFPEPGTKIHYGSYSSVEGGFALGGDEDGFFAALRRYLQIARDEDRERAEARMAPFMEPLLTGPRPAAHARVPDEDSSRMILQGYVAFAFSKGTDWADQILRRHVRGDFVCMDNSLPNLVVACKDIELAALVCKGFDFTDEAVAGGRCPLGLTDHRLVFDFIESFGSDSVEMLSSLNVFSFVEKKVQSALKLARKLSVDS